MKETKVFKQLSYQLYFEEIFSEAKITFSIKESINTFKI